MLPYKHERLAALLRQWTEAQSYSLLEIAQLLGTLENHTKYARWAHCWYSTLQNHVHRALHARYAILSRKYNHRDQEARFLRQLPLPLVHHVESLVARDKAHLLWSTRQCFAVNGLMLNAVGHLLSYVESTDTPCEVPLGMIVPRDPHFWSRGDASLLGGGAYCPGLRFWFDIGWSA
jgi:hypothetical protein